ncbi:MAG: DUF4410 domain-containing protein [Stellaceae bacterium]
MPGLPAYPVRRRIPLGFFCALLLLTGCSTAKVTSSGAVGTAPALRPAVVYVADFDLDAAEITSEPGLLGSRPRLGILPQGPLGIVGKPDPQAQARHLVDLMAQTLLDDLRKAGLDARRAPAGAVLPAEGWLVRGAFLQVDEGNRLRRAVIGFGEGQTRMQLAVAIDALSQGLPAPFYQVDTSAKSHDLPGAVVTLNPYVAAARFVLAGQDLDKNVKDSAGKVAESVVARVNAPAGSPQQ